MKKEYVIAIVALIVIVAGFFIFSNIDKEEVQESPVISNEFKISILDYSPFPKELSIKLGDKVTWTNKDKASHTIKSETGDAINSESIATGESYSQIFNVAGTYDYKIASGNTGKIIVS